MDMNENNNFVLKKSRRTHSSGVSAGWQFNSQAMSAVPGPANASIVAGLATPVTFSPYPSAQMVENHHNNSPNKGVGENNIPSTAGTSNYISIAKPVAMSSTRILLPASGNFPSSLPHFPTDLAFIERAARFSCFGGGNFSGMNLFGPSLPVASSTNALKDVMGAQLPKADVNTIVSSTDRCPIQNQRDWGNSHIGTSWEAKFTEGGQEGKTNSADASGNSSPSNASANKRRRTIQDMEQNQVQRGPQSSSETTKEKTEAKQKVEHNSSKHVVKGRKDNLEAAREDYVHVRARRGQATNNHSLAERIRREKISERMKYLQELVPGCSKVTGKADMLDEIINYVQSLQRQVEFLSMKLAAVNPQLDFGVEGLVCQNIPQSHGGSSSGIAFSPDMMYSQVYPSQLGMAHVGVSAVVNPSDAFRRANTQLSTTSGYKESSLKVHNPWNEELAMQMTYGANPPSAQERVDKPHGFTI